jgi:hypothetical protein
MSVAQPGFDSSALYDPLDERRRSREMSWIAVAREINRSVKRLKSPLPRPVPATSGETRDATMSSGVALILSFSTADLNLRPSLICTAVNAL